jgi:hypothetical protein
MEKNFAMGATRKKFFNNRNKKELSWAQMKKLVVTEAT